MKKQDMNRLQGLLKKKAELLEVEARLAGSDGLGQSMNESTGAAYHNHPGD